MNKFCGNEYTISEVVTDNEYIRSPYYYFCGDGENWAWAFDECVLEDVDVQNDEMQLSITIDDMLDNNADIKVS